MSDNIEIFRVGSQTSVHNFVQLTGDIGADAAWRELVDTAVATSFGDIEPGTIASELPLENVQIVRHQYRPTQSVKTWPFDGRTECVVFEQTTEQLNQKVGTGVLRVVNGAYGASTDSTTPTSVTRLALEGITATVIINQLDLDPPFQSESDLVDIITNNHEIRIRTLIIPAPGIIRSFINIEAGQINEHSGSIFVPNPWRTDSIYGLSEHYDLYSDDYRYPAIPLGYYSNSTSDL